MVWRLKNNNSQVHGRWEYNCGGHNETKDYYKSSSTHVCCMLEWVGSISIENMYWQTYEVSLRENSRLNPDTFPNWCVSELDGKSPIFWDSTHALNCLLRCRRLTRKKGPRSCIVLHSNQDGSKNSGIGSPVWEIAPKKSGRRYPAPLGSLVLHPPAS